MSEDKKTAAPTAKPTTMMRFHAEGGGLVLTSLDDLSKFANALVASGYFKGVNAAAHAIVKLQYGAEFGLPPIAAMLNIYVVDGKPSMGAQLIAALIKRSGVYRYRVSEWDEKKCSILFSERVDNAFVDVGVSTFTIEDAKRAGLLSKTVWQSYPNAMLFARAMSKGARAYCPDLFFGSVYTPEELGAAGLDADGVPVGARDVSPALDEKPKAAAPPTPPTVEDAEVLPAKGAAESNVVPHEEQPSSPATPASDDASPASEPAPPSPSAPTSTAESSPASSSSDGPRSAEKPSDAPSVIAPDDVFAAETKTPDEAKQVALSGALVEMQRAVDLPGMSAVVAKWKPKLADDAPLRMFGRARWNMARKMAKDAGMSDGEKAALAAAIKIVGEPTPPTPTTK